MTIDQLENYWQDLVDVEALPKIKAAGEAAAMTELAASLKRRAASQLFHIEDPDAPPVDPLRSQRRPRKK